MEFMPGFRFHPTDEELVIFYLLPMMQGNTGAHLQIITTVELYQYDPHELPAMAISSPRDTEWFFFVPKYVKGNRPSRLTKSGYWKATGSDKTIMCENGTMAVKKTLVFYKGKAPTGAKSNWVMQEYRLSFIDEDQIKNDVNLCRVYKKGKDSLQVCASGVIDQQVLDHDSAMDVFDDDALESLLHLVQDIPNYDIEL